MKFSMMVLMTSCEPKRAFSTPGIAPQTPPATIAGEDKHMRNQQPRRGRFAKVMPTQAVANARHVELSFGADVQQAAAKGHRHREAGEDQRRRVEERVADAVRPGEGAADEQLVGLDGIVADEEDEDAADEKGRDHGDQREKQFAQEFHLVVGT